MGRIAEAQEGFYDANQARQKHERRPARRATEPGYPAKLGGPKAERPPRSAFRGRLDGGRFRSADGRRASTRKMPNRPLVSYFPGNGPSTETISVRLSVR